MTRSVPGWQYFDDHPEISDVVQRDGMQALSADDRKVAEWFIAVFRGSRHVLDLGCGCGFPAVYLAAHVDHIAAVDAAPHVILRAQEHAAAMGVGNVTFVVGGDHGLDYADATFDGAMLCGVLESMAWAEVRPFLAEVHRVTKPGARIAIVDQDWSEVLERLPTTSVRLRSHNGYPQLLVIERLRTPPIERTTCYVLNPEMAFTQALLTQSASGEPRALTASEIDPASILDAWQDEWAEFDLTSLREVVTEQGFEVAEAVSAPIWQRVILLTATRK